MFDETDWRTNVLLVVLFVALIPAAWWLSAPGRFGGDRPEPVPTAAPTAEPTPVAVATTLDEPPPTPPFIATTPPQTTPPAPPSTAVTPPEAPLGETVLFRGGPAVGPWQQIGSVAELHHPDADPNAGFYYERNWSDPTQENMPASLWDVIVAQVAEQAVQLGPPLDRAPFDRPDESVVHNAFGGTHSADFDQRLLVAAWAVYYLRPDGVAALTEWPYLITFEGTILERGERFEVDETMFTESSAAVDQLTAELDAWSAPLIAAYEGPGP